MTYTVPHVPAGPEAAALEMIVRVPVDDIPDGAVAVVQEIKACAMETTTPATFEAIIAAFDDWPRCEVKTAADGRCKLAASYHAVFHDCGAGLVCTGHMRAFLRQVSAGGRVQCNRCDRVFASIDQAFTLVVL